MRVSFSGAATREIWANPFGCDPDAPARTQLHRARALLLLTAWVEQETQLGTQGTHLTLHAAEWTCIMDEAAAVDTRMQSSPMCIGMRTIWTPPPPPLTIQSSGSGMQWRHSRDTSKTKFTSDVLVFIFAGSVEFTSWCRTCWMQIHQGCFKGRLWIKKHQPIPIWYFYIQVYSSDKLFQAAASPLLRDCFMTPSLPVSQATRCTLTTVGDTGPRSQITKWLAFIWLTLLVAK